MSETPQLENGFTKIANEILDAFSSNRIPGEQMQCLMVIIRRTYGYHSKEARISNTEFMIATGLKRPSICRALNSLIQKNIVSKKANSKEITYRFNKDYNSWKQLSKKLIVSKKANNRYQKSEQLLAKKLTTPIKDNIKIKEIYTSAFLNFYSAYPIKKAKEAALKAWQKAKPDLDTCLKAIESQKLEKKKLKEAGQFCPEWKHPATWINQGCWEDEPIKTEAEDERERFLRRHSATE